MKKNENLWRDASADKKEQVQRFWEKISHANGGTENYFFSKERGFQCLRCNKEYFLWERMFSLKQHLQKCLKENSQNLFQAKFNNLHLNYQSYLLNNSLEKTNLNNDKDPDQTSFSLHISNSLPECLPSFISSSELINRSDNLIANNSFLQIDTNAPNKSCIQSEKSKTKIKRLSNLEAAQSFFNNEVLAKAYKKFKKEKGKDFETNKHKMCNLKKVIVFLEFCYQNQYSLTSDSIENFVNNHFIYYCKQKKIESYDELTKNKIKSIFNSLLEKDKKLKIHNLELNSEQKVRKEVNKNIDIVDQKIILTHFLLNDYELYRAILIAKYAFPRIDELVRLQVKHFIEMDCPKKQFYVAYFQEKTQKQHGTVFTKPQRAVEIPECVYQEITFGKKPDDFCISWQRADSLSHYLLDFCQENNVPHYSIHCWRHTATTRHKQQEICFEGQIHQEFQNFLNEKAKFILGHSRNSNKYRYYSLLLSKFEEGIKGLMAEGKWQGLHDLVSRELIKTLPHLKRNAVEGKEMSDHYFKQINLD